MTVLGADGCPGGAWVVAQVGGGAADVAGPACLWLATDTAELLDRARFLGVQAVALDVPIGLPDHGRRDCDLAARSLLGAGRASSVFAAPTRRVLAARTYLEGRSLQPSLSAQTFALMPRIRQVDEELRRRGPTIHSRVVECHPEVVFQRLVGHPLPGKKTAAGALQRIAALTDALGALPRLGPVEAGLDDALDALACAWTALRWAGGTAEVLGGAPDSAGVPMRIVI